jgi:hypothetical protein
MHQRFFAAADQWGCLIRPAAAGANVVGVNQNVAGAATRAVPDRRGAGLPPMGGGMPDAAKTSIWSNRRIDRAWRSGRHRARRAGQSV